ncbi:MAG: PDZ domain-containing protein [Fimbriiglobus sp.]
MLAWPILTLALLAPATLPDDPAKATSAEATKVQLVPYRLTDTKHIMVRVKINGKGPFNLILDTGAPSVFLATKVAEKAGISTDRSGWAEVDSFEIEGGFKVKDAKTRVSDLFQLEGMNGMGLAGVELHGVIGYNVLAKYRITYDFTADKLQFAPLDFKPPAVNMGGKSNSQGSMDMLGPVMKMMAGLMGIKPNFTAEPRGILGAQIGEKESKIVVEKVFADSPAAKAGLKKGDVITAASQGKKMVEMDRFKDFTRWINETTGGQKVKIQVERGGETVTLNIELGKGV